MNTTRTYTMDNRAEGVADTKARIARAAMGLLIELPYEDVTLAAIAKAAGVSHQTVLNHFESKEGVAFAAAVLIAEQTTQARSTERRGDAKSAIHALTSEYERLGDANFRWAAGADRLGRLAVLLEEGRASHKRWLEDHFGDRMPATPAARARVLAAIYAATDVYTWKLLRRDLHLSRRETERVMVDTVSAVLAQTSTTVKKAKSR